MWITATDSKEFTAGPGLLTINLVNPRQPPAISNLPALVTLPEDTMSTDVFFTVSLFNNYIDNVSL